MSDLFMSINRPSDELVQAARAIAWDSGLDCGTMEGLVRKVIARADRQRVTTVLRRPCNDDGGTG